MTDQEYLESYRADCNFAAQDTKNAADYAAYNFSKGEDEKAIEYAKRAEAACVRMMGCINSLQKWIAK